MYEYAQHRIVHAKADDKQLRSFFENFATVICIGSWPYLSALGGFAGRPRKPLPGPCGAYHDTQSAVILDIGGCV